MSDFFKTLSSPAEGIYKDKMSKFLSFAHPVETAEEAKEIIKAYQKKYFDARHVCWAYMIGTSRTEFLSNDNGEPSGTAGKPILGQINSFELTNIVIVVVRYFGGILLGAGPLSRTYLNSARVCIDECEKKEIYKYEEFSFICTYNGYNIIKNKLENYIENEYVKIQKCDFKENVEMTLDIVDFEFENIKGIIEEVNYGN